MNNLFGTDGIRGKVGTQPFTHASLVRLGSALLQWLSARSSYPHIIVAQDPRASSDWIKSSLYSTLLRSPITIYDAGVLPTPAIPLLIKKMNLDAGIMISASHNPHTDNGIKLFNRDGKIETQDEYAITNLLLSKRNSYGYRAFGKIIPYADAQEIYLGNIASKARFFDLSNKTIVIDCANGALSSYAAAVLRKYNAKVVALYCTPNGQNINESCGSVYPDMLQRTVLEHSADIGLAFDGDGDRLIAISKDGIIKNGDNILALLSTHQSYENEKTVVGTVMSNKGLEGFLHTQGKKLLRTPVGDKYIHRALKEHASILGGEQSGHIILGDYNSCGDGLFTALKLLEVVSESNNWEMKSFTSYPQFHISIPARSQISLTEEPIASHVRKIEQSINGRILVRYSGTQPLLRIMVEDIDKEAAQKVAYNLAQYIGPYISKE